MSQADTNTTTRREMLLMLARASAAITLPASTVFAFAADHPDADILRIAAELNSQLDIYEPLSQAARDANDAWHDKDDPASILRASGYDAWGRAREEAGVESAMAKANDYYETFVGPLETALVHLPAKTLDGLAAKAAIVRRFVADPFWDADDSDADWDVLAVRRIVDEAIAIAATAKA